MEPADLAGVSSESDKLQPNLFARVLASEDTFAVHDARSPHCVIGTNHASSRKKDAATKGAVLSRDEQFAAK
jgi:hypothetical protein